MKYRDVDSETDRQTVLTVFGFSHVVLSADDNLWQSVTASVFTLQTLPWCNRSRGSSEPSCLWLSAAVCSLDSAGEKKAKDFFICQSLFFSSKCSFTHLNLKLQGWTLTYKWTSVKFKPDKFTQCWLSLSPPGKSLIISQYTGVFKSGTRSMAEA